MKNNYSYFLELDNMEYRMADCAHCMEEFSYHYPHHDVYLTEQPILCQECCWVVDQDTHKAFINSLRKEFKSYSGKVNTDNYGMDVLHILIQKYEKEFENNEEKLMVFYMTMHPFVGLSKGGYNESPLFEMIQTKIERYVEELKR